MNSEWSFPTDPDIHTAAARIFYKIAKNHTLLDGNKRSAVICVVLFFLKNNKSVGLSADDFYWLAKRVVTDRGGTEKVISKAADFFRKFVV